MNKVPFAAPMKRLQQGKQQTSTPPPISRRIAPKPPEGPLGGPHEMETKQLAGWYKAMNGIN